MAKSVAPFSAFEWMVAMRYLRPRKAEAFISVISILSLIGIALGVAVVITVMSVMNGFRSQLLDRILGMQAHLHVSAYAETLENWQPVLDRVIAIPGVTLAYPVVEDQVLVTTPNVTVGALVRGMRYEDIVAIEDVSRSLTPSTREAFMAGTSLIIGSGLASQTGVLPGSTLTLTSPRGAVTPFGTTPRVKAYPVAGTFQVGMSEYDRIFVFAPLEEAQLFFNRGQAVNRIDVMVNDPDNIGPIRAAIAEALGPNFRLQDWQEINGSLFGALQVERFAMFLILTMIILVASLNIISGLIMLVKDKGSDIAILRTMGATRGTVMRVFFINGSTIGLSGTLTGFLLALLVCSNIEGLRQFFIWAFNIDPFSPDIYFLNQMSAQMENGEVAAVVIVALVLSFLATLYPSWRASRIDPVEALRYE